jgi:choline dehydrogenase-like flavoprotein
MLLLTVTLLKPEVTQRILLRRAEQEMESSRADEGRRRSTASTSASASASPSTDVGQKAQAPLLVPENSENQSPYPNNTGVGKLTARDRMRLVWGLEQARKTMKTDPIGTWMRGELFPGESLSDEQLDHWVQHNAVPANQWSGSCKMGRAEDPMAVVDDHFRVYGVDKLRVVDAAVMPRIISADVHVTELAIAQYASQLLADG